MSEHHEETHAIIGPLEYSVVYLALLVGLALQIFLAFHNLGIFNPILMLLVAFAQAGLVAVFSMHLKTGNKLNGLSVGSALFVLAILIAMVLIDYSSRAWGRW